jgi:hypothetical protein
MVLPLISTAFIIQEYLYIHQFVLPHQFTRDLLTFLSSYIVSPQNAEILISHKILTIEHDNQYY